MIHSSNGDFFQSPDQTLPIERTIAHYNYHFLHFMINFAKIFIRGNQEIRSNFSKTIQFALCRYRSIDRSIDREGKKKKKVTKSFYNQNEKSRLESFPTSSGAPLLLRIVRRRNQIPRLGSVKLVACCNKD